MVAVLGEMIRAIFRTSTFRWLSRRLLRRPSIFGLLHDNWLRHTGSAEVKLRGVG
jgi:hypothetical protein